MKTICDMHTHTIASGHAYSSMLEMIRAAKEAGLAMLGISEHGPVMPGSCHPIYFENLKVVPRKQMGIEVRLGVELNIVDLQGNLDLEERVLDRLDYAIASFHPNCVKPGSREENTYAMIQVIKNPRVQIIGHPDDSRFPLDYEAVVQAAKESHTLLELNNHSLGPKGVRVNADENDEVMLKLCKKYRAPIIVNSDAHYVSDVGEHNLALQLLERLQFPEELVANCPGAVKRVEAYLPIRE